MIESAYAQMSAEPADTSERDQARCAKELHVGNPAFIRGLTFEQFALAAHAYYFGLKVAAQLVASGAGLNADPNRPRHFPESEPADHTHEHDRASDDGMPPPPEA